MVEKIQNIITGTYKLREARAKAQEAEANNKIIQMMSEDIESKIKEKLAELSKWVMSQSVNNNAERKAELNQEAGKVLEDIASRLDNGYQFEGDVGEIPEEEENEGEEKSAEAAVASQKLQLQREKIQEIKKLSHSIQYTELPQQPVLGLPKPVNDDQPGEKKR